jgi:hypothetical protein
MKKSVSKSNSDNAFYREQRVAVGSKKQVGCPHHHSGDGKAGSV